MSDYYNHSGYPSTASAGISASARAEFALVAAGFNKLPALSGNANKIVVVNGTATGLTVTSSALTLNGDLTKAGSHALTLTTTGTTTVTFPTTGTLVARDSTDTLTNKTLTAPVLSGSVTGTYTLAGTPTITAPILSGSVTGTYTLAGTPTITAPTISSPTFSGTSGGTWTLGGTVTMGSPILTGTLNLATSSGTITFPGSSGTGTPSGNVLQDYEEGTWTPSLGGTATYTTQVGRYTRIGRMVYVNCRLVVNSIGSGSQAIVSGLPFSTANTAFQVLTVGKTGSLALSVVSITAVCSIFGTTFSLYSRLAAATGDGINNVLGNSSEVNVSGWYECVP